MAKAVPVVGVGPMSGQENEWQAERDMETMIEYHKIKADPQRHARARAKAHEKKKHLEKVAGRGGHGDVPASEFKTGFRRLG